MSGTWHWYGNGLLKVLQGSIDLDTDTFKILLTTSAYTPNQDTDDFRNDVTNEVANSGTYAAGGGATTVSLSYDAATNEVRVILTDVAFTGATITARTAVLYKSRGGVSSADELVGYCTESSDVSSTAGTFTIDNPATAALKITVS